MAGISGPTGQQDKQATDVLKAWAATVNASGGINGHPVVLDIKDTRGDPSTATTVAGDLIADKSVVGLVSLSSTTEGVIGKLVSQSDVVVVGGEGYNPTVWSALPGWYGITTTFPSVVTVQVASAVAVGSKNLEVIGCAEDPSCLAADPVFAGAAKAAKVKFSGALTVAATAPNYTAQCIALKQNGIDFAQFSLSGAVALRVANDCLTQGYTGFFGASSGTVTTDLLGVKGIKLAGGLNAFPWWIDTPAVTAYRTAMQTQKVPTAEWQQSESTGAWATGELFKTALAGVTAGEEVTRATVASAYGKITNQDVGGLLPAPVTFTAGKPAPLVNCYWLYTYQDGNFGPGSDKPTCPPSS